MTIKEMIEGAIVLLQKNNIDESLIKSKIILSKCIGRSKEYLFIHGDEEVETKIKEIFFEKIDKLCKNIPLQYITNEQEFMGLSFFVNENVLIPRCDTEILVETVLHSMNKSKTKKIKVLDMCTGSGIIAIVLAKECDNAEITAVDKSELALNVAIKNANLHKVYDRIEFIKSDMFENLNSNYDIIVSNPPYIEKDTIKTLSKDVQNEPIMALDGGEDGLKFYRIISNNIDRYLNKNGNIFLEIGYNQKESVSNLFKPRRVECIKDLSGLDRVIVVK